MSVSDKSGLVDFCRRLEALGVRLVSSGGTAAVLEEAGVEVTGVTEVTGAPEMLEGRVKTLHPRIHGGILARADRDLHSEELRAHGIEPFELVVVNLYPFRETASRGESSDEEVVEQIDIGGPALIRAAAKNHEFVGVVTNPGQYAEVAQAIEGGGLTLEHRMRLAREAFFHTASYDAAILAWMESHQPLPERLVLPLRRSSTLRYGENPHQLGAIYVEDGSRPWWVRAHLRQGKEMSFNNWIDAEAAWRLVNALPSPAAVVVKHTNPCGAAVGDSPAQALAKAWAGDPLAAFGGVVAINAGLDAETATLISQRFVEVVVVPESPDAGPLSHKPDLRLLEAFPPGSGDLDLRRMERGFVAQERDESELADWKVMTSTQPTPEQWEDLRLAWTVAAHTKSNAVVLAAGGATVGVGSGDQSRVGAVRRALAVALARSRSAVAASDAFFPFRDGIDELASAGVGAVVAPSGSRRDQEVIDAANEHGLALVFTGRRHFRH